MRKKTKFFLLRISVILAFAILAGKLWYVQVVMGSYYKQQGDVSKIRLEPVPALRGILYDRHGRQLVWNSPSWNVDIVPNAVPSNRASSIFHRLATILGNRPGAGKIALTVSQNTWRGYAPITIKGNVPFPTAMTIMELHQFLPGVQANAVSIRQYALDPQQSLAHVLGYTTQVTSSAFDLYSRTYPGLHYTAADETGASGVEASMEPYLHGVNGTAEVEVDAGERPVRVIRPGRAVPGDRVYLTIDANLERQVAQDLGAALAKYQLRRGVVVVENVHTGEILAMVSLPSFNDNWFSTPISLAHWNSLNTDPAHPLDDQAIAGQFPPGSIYKMITAAAALQTGVVDAATTYDDTGAISLCSVYDPSACQVFHGWKPGGLGPENVVTAIAQSSDIYFYTVAGGNPNTTPDPPHVGADRLAHFAHLFGLGAPTGINLPGEASGFIPSAYWFDHVVKPGPLKHPGDSWHIGDTYNMAIGQGFNLVTPLQMANVTSAIANGGTLYRPQIVERITGRIEPRARLLSHNALIQPFVPSIVRRNFVDPANISLIQQGMHLGVDATQPWYGTSWLVHDPRIDAAGKTGTAEDPHGSPDAWWTGFAPFNNPQIAVTVLVPNAGAEGSYYAAPIAHKVLEDYFHLKPTLPDHPGDTNWLDDVLQQELPSNTQ